jgi:lysophospholipase L1-like esterase
VIDTGCLAREFYLASDITLTPTFAALASNRGCGFPDAGRFIASNPIDRVHFDEAAHATLGAAIAGAVKFL